MLGLLFDNCRTVINYAVFSLLNTPSSLHLPAVSQINYNTKLNDTLRYLRISTLYPESLPRFLSRFVTNI